MDVNTKELVSPDFMATLAKDVDINEHFAARLKKMTEVPGELEDDARELLDGKDSVVVRSDTQAGKRMYGWAEDERIAQRRRRNKAARKSRKANRK